MYKLMPGALAAPALLAAATVLVTAPGAEAAPRGTRAGTPAGAPAAPIGGAQLTGKGVIRNPAAGVKKPPKVSASSYVISDADTGQILAAKDPHGYYRPASTLKILTAITLIPRLDPKKMVTPSWKACNVDGTRVGIEPTMKYSTADLFRGMLMVSGNDAAVSLAEQPAGGMTTTLKWMNAEARSLQADDTVAMTPNGLDHKHQRTSAYDLALFARHGLADPRFRAYIGQVSYKFPAPRTKAQRKKHRSGGYMIYNHDRLLTQYRGGMGVQNGYTVKAMGTFVGAAKRDGHTILVTLMHSNPDFWPDAMKMLDWGFAARAKAKPVGQLVGPAAASASGTAAHTAGKKTASGAKPKRAAADAGGPGGGDGTPVIAGALAVLAVFGGAGYTLARRRRHNLG